jgi:cytidine deaminase
MKDIELLTTIQAKEYNELDPLERELVERAKEALKGSYAPYSHFKVGAAIRLDNGEIITGANQENVAFPSGTCAERSAAFYAGANYPDSGFDMMAIASVGPDGLVPMQPTPPCGACRQALLEYEMRAGHNVPVLLAGRDCVYRVPSIKSLLPLSFTEF